MQELQELRNLLQCYGIWVQMARPNCLEKTFVITAQENAERQPGEPTSRDPCLGCLIRVLILGRGIFHVYKFRHEVALVAY